MGKKLFGKGNPGKPEGSVNKVTQTARELFVKTLESQVEGISECFDAVRQEDPAKFLELFAKYAQYFVPKQLDVNLGGKVIKVITPKKKESE